jgi:hypothetical protein
MSRRKANTYQKEMFTAKARQFVPTHITVGNDVMMLEALEIAFSK